MELERSIYRQYFENGTIDFLWNEHIGDDDEREKCEDWLRKEFKSNCLIVVTIVQCKYMIEKQFPKKKQQFYADQLKVDRTTFGRYLSGNHAMPLQLLLKNHEILIEHGLKYPSQLPRYAAARTINLMLKERILKNSQSRDRFRFSELADMSFDNYFSVLLLLRDSGWNSAFEREDYQALRELSQSIISEIRRACTTTSLPIDWFQLAHLFSVWRVPFLLSLDSVLCAPDFVPGVSH